MAGVEATAEDALDLIVRIVVIVPLLALLTWWAGSMILGVLGAAIGR